MTKVHGELTRTARTYRIENLLLKRKLSEKEEAEGDDALGAENDDLRAKNAFLQDELVRAHERFLAIHRIAMSDNGFDSVFRC